jgi:hypothetical protein
MSVPARFWGEAVRHSVYLLNCLPTKVLGNCTPYESWKGRKPHLGHVRVFGCTANVKNAVPHLKKLDVRSHKMIYLGVEEGCKAHRLYDPQHNKIVVSRDVIFEEDVKWKWSAQNGDAEVFEFQVQDENLSGEGFGVGGNVPNAVAGGDGNQSPGAMSSSGGAPEVQHSPGAHSGHEVGGNSPTTSSVRNLTIDLNSANTASPVQQPQFELDNSEADVSASGEESSEEDEVRFRDLNDIYQNSSEVELMYDSGGEAMLVEMEEPTSYKEAASCAEWTEAMDKEI